MKYNPALTQKLLFLLEERLDGKDSLSIDNIQIPGHERDEILEHLQLLKDEGCIISTAQWADDMIVEYLVSRLTPNGHKLLAAARDNKVWPQFLQIAKATGLEITKTGFSVALGVVLNNMLP